MRPILLIGKTGQLGWELQRALAPLRPIVALGSEDIELTALDSVGAAIRAVRPSLIVNAAAYTAVDRAQEEADLARLVNTAAPGVMAEVARVLGIPLVHYSTDYVFDGEKTSAYVESDLASPLSVYGRTKLDGELAVQSSGACGIILRTSWVFGEVGGNFVRTILRLASERDAIRVVSDQTGAPTPAALLADITAHAVRQLDGQGWPSARIYHVASSHDVSWHAFAEAIVTTALRLGMPLRLKPDAIEPISTGEYPTPARRPRNSRLDCTAASREFSLSLPSWEPYLERMLARVAGAGV